jgi:para-nitrobenzyl esterase
MATPRARGLFAKAIVESGGGWSPPTTLAKREAQGEALAAKAGAPAGATVEQLRAIPADALIAANGQDFGDAIDGRLLTQSPTQAFAAGHAAKVPLLIGSNSYEASLMESFKLSPAMVLAFAPAAARPAYADLKSDSAVAQAMFTDAFMGAPARWVAGQSSGGPAYLYHFSYVPEARRASVPGAGHATEIPFVFDTWDKLGVMAMGVKLTPADKAVVSTMHACWVAFAKTGAPVCPGAAKWPAYDRASDTLMEFDGAPPALKTHFDKPRLDAMEAASLPKLGL